MSTSNAEALRDKRAESLARRPTLAVAGEAGAQERKYEGRRKHAAAAVIAIDRIIPDADQPRQEFPAEEHGQLVASMKSVGQITPIQVRWSEGAGHYVVIAGERRWRAAREAGLEHLNCVVVDGELTPDKLVEVQLMENACRADLKPVEQGRAYRKLMEARGLTQRDLADMLRISHASIAQTVALLDLAPAIQESVDAGEIGATAAYEIAKVADPDAQARLADDVKAGRLKRDELRERVASGRPKAAAKGGGAGKGRGPKLPTARTVRLDSGHKVTVEHRKGVDPTGLAGALRAALAKVEAEIAGDQAAA